MQVWTSDSMNQHDDDAKLFDVCQKFLEQERLMVAWARSGVGIDEGLAAAASKRWRSLLQEIADIQAHTQTGRLLKLHCALGAARESCQDDAVESKMILSALL